MHKYTRCCRPAHMDVQRHTGERLAKPSEPRTSLPEETLLSDLLISYWRDGSGLTLLLFSLTLTTTLPLPLWEGTTCLAYIPRCSPLVFMFPLKCCSACNQQCSNVSAKKGLLQRCSHVFERAHKGIRLWYKCLSTVVERTTRTLVYLPARWLLMSPKSPLPDSQLGPWRRSTRQAQFFWRESLMSYSLSGKPKTRVTSVDTLQIYRLKIKCPPVNFTSLSVIFHSSNYTSWKALRH